MRRHIFMVLRLLPLLFVCLAAAKPVQADATLFRVFLVDGSSVVSFGEMARVNDQVIFSMPVGGTADDPRLHAVTLASAVVDWPRTERHAVSARYLKYFETRAESDYERLTTEVAGVLNRIAQTSERGIALALAKQVRRTLAEWPGAHFGYRQNEVRDIIMLLDQSISRLRGIGTIELSLVATIEPVPLEPVAAMPSRREQLEQILRVLRVTTSGRDRVALLQSGLTLLSERDSSIAAADARRFGRSLDAQLRRELAIDAQYARLTESVLASASAAAADASISGVERALGRIDRGDAKLGRHRPEVIQAARDAVQRRLGDARRLRLLRDQWQVRRDLYRDYERAAGSQMARLLRAQPALEAIKRVGGPPPNELKKLRSSLSGGAERLERIPTPDYLRATHQLLVGAWRFAETAAQTRYDAIASGNLTTAWEASSAAAGALLMFSRAQQELRALLEPPTLEGGR